MKPDPRTGLTKVERLRLAQGLSYERLAQLARLDPVTVGRYARGEVTRPRMLTLWRLAEALGCDVWDLVREYEGGAA